MDTYDIGMKKPGSKVQTLLLAKTNKKRRREWRKVKGERVSRKSTLLLFKMKEQVWWYADENDFASCKREGMELEVNSCCGTS